MNIFFQIDVLQSDVETDQNDTEENEATFNLVRHLHDSNGLQGSDEEWLEDETTYTTYEPKRKKMTYRTIKREVTTPPRRTSHMRTKPAPAPILIDSSHLKDEYAVFGEYVANKLRKFKAPRTRGNLQQLITTILWQAEYGTYDSADAVKRLLMYSVQEPEPAIDHSGTQQEFVQTEEVIGHREEPNQIIEVEA